MVAEQSTSRNLLNGFIKISQYLIGLPEDADIWQEAPKALVNFFKADISFVAGRRHRKTNIEPFCLSLERHHCQHAMETCRQIVDEVIRDGFLASEMFDLPERHAIAFLPVSHDNQVVAVLAVGHCQDSRLGKEELNTYLGVASLLETILAEKISEQRFQLMADNVPEMLFRIAVQPDNTKKFDYVSKGSFHVLGCAPEELKSTPLLFFKNLVKGDSLSLDRQIMEAATEGQRFIHTVCWRTPAGQEKYIELHAQASQEGDGTVYLDGAAQDITARKQGEEQIRKAKKEWERTFDAIGDIVTLMDTEMRILRVNHAACKALDATPKELIGKHCYEVFAGTFSPCSACPAPETIKDSKIHYVEITHKNLGRTFQVSTSPLVDKLGRLLGIVHFAKDISKQKNLEQQLRQTQKMSAIGTLAGGIAHDFNNLLTPILGYAEILLHNAPSDSRQARDIIQISKAGNRAKELVKQILTFSRKSKLEHVPLQIQGIAQEAIKLLRSSIPATIEIKQDIDSRCPAVMADPTEIHQVIMNFCTNAYHAMRKSGGTLAISLAPVKIEDDELHAQMGLKSGRYVRLEVSDTGPGMSQETKERIFEPYFTTKETGDGTGLGLAVVHGIVSSCGGTITVYSEPDQGSSFHVYFPVIKHETVEAQELEEALLTGEGHILAVDDSKAIVELEQRILETLGYSVTPCTCPKKALEMFKAQPDLFDLLLTDMTMPGMTGAQLISEIFAIRPKMPVILCTGFSELINEEQAKALGVGAYVMKPIIKKELATALHKILCSNINNNKE